METGQPYAQALIARRLRCSDRTVRRLKESALEAVVRIVWDEQGNPRWDA